MSPKLPLPIFLPSLYLPCNTGRLATGLQTGSSGAVPRSSRVHVAQACVPRVFALPQAQLLPHKRSPASAELLRTMPAALIPPRVSRRALQLPSPLS
jgi:hypothetical protein